MQQKLSSFPSQNNMGRRSHGFPQQCYTDEGMWMETQAQQQGHAFHEDSWSTDNNYHKQQYPGMHMKPGGGAYATDSDKLSMSKHHGKLGGNYGMFPNSIPGGGHHGHGHGFGHHDVHGGGKKYPYGGTTVNSPHHFSNGGGTHGRFNHSGGGHHDYISEEYEYEAYKEEHVGAATAKMDEKRYERHNWGGDVHYANPYGGGYNSMKPPHGYGHGGHKVEWTVKGV